MHQQISSHFYKSRSVKKQTDTSDSSSIYKHEQKRGGSRHWCTDCPMGTLSTLLKQTKAHITSCVIQWQPHILLSSEPLKNKPNLFPLIRETERERVTVFNSQAMHSSFCIKSKQLSTFCYNITLQHAPMHIVFVTIVLYHV